MLHSLIWLFLYKYTNFIRNDTILIFYLPSSKQSPLQAL